MSSAFYQSMVDKHGEEKARQIMSDLSKKTKNRYQPTPEESAKGGAKSKRGKAKSARKEI